MADTAVSSWSGGADTTWSGSGNWVGGVPSNTLGAVFDSSFANQPNLTNNATSLGFWVKTGVGQNVTVSSTGARTLTLSEGATLNGLIGSSGNPNHNAGVVILMDDNANRNLTFGPDITLAPGNTTAILVNNAGTLTIQGQLNDPNGQGVVLGGTNTLGVIRITGRLGGTGGGSIRVRTAGTVILESGSPSYTKGFAVDSGVCRLNHPEALKAAGVAFNGGTTQLRADTDVLFPFGATAGVFGSTPTFDVGRLDPIGGSAVGKTLRLDRLAPGNGTKISATGTNGYRLAIGSLTCGNGYPSTVAVNPTTASVTVGDITSVTMQTGRQAVALDGTCAGNEVTGVISNAPTGGYGVDLVKGGTSVWTLRGANIYDGPTTVNGGKLVAAHSSALGFGGAARIGQAGAVAVAAASAVLELSGVTVHKPIVLTNGGSLVNNNTGSASRLGDGVAYVSFTGRGSGFVGADVGKPLTLSGGGGSGATAFIAALCANSNTVTASGGTGWVTGNTITLTGGGATQSAVYDVTATAGAITALTIKTSNPGPGYGYTAAPTGFTRTGSGTGAVITFFDNFSVAAITTTAPGSGYTSAPVVSTAGTSGSGLVATAALSSLSAAYIATGSTLGGDGDLAIDGIVSGNCPLTKIGTGTLSLGGSNTYARTTVVAAGTLSAVNTRGSATGTWPVTVNNGATLAGSGYLVPTYNTSGIVIDLQTGSRLAPHVGTGLDTATLHANVSASSSANALNIAGGTTFEFALGAGGASDRLSVTGNLTLGAGVNDLRVVKRAGFGAGTYTLVEVPSGTMTYNITSWTVPNDAGWTYAIKHTATTITLDVAATGTLVLIR